jgi:ferritin-like metal-binding protein YciE
LTPAAAITRGRLSFAQLQAAFDANLLTTWQQSARVQACFTQINHIAFSLNSIRKNAGEEAAASELLARSSEILAAFKEFRATILPGGEV